MDGSAGVSGLVFSFRPQAKQPNAKELFLQLNFVSIAAYSNQIPSGGAFICLISWWCRVL